jgi:hypothetical protein
MKADLVDYVEHPFQKQLIVWRIEVMELGFLFKFVESAPNQCSLKTKTLVLRRGCDFGYSPVPKGFDSFADKVAKYNDIFDMENYRHVRSGYIRDKKNIFGGKCPSTVHYKLYMCTSCCKSEFTASLLFFDQRLYIEKCCAKTPDRSEVYAVQESNQ